MNEDVKLITRVNDEMTISSHNVIPAGRQVTQEDIDNFVNKIKKNIKDNK